MAARLCFTAAARAGVHAISASVRPAVSACVQKQCFSTRKNRVTAEEHTERILAKRSIEKRRDAEINRDVESIMALAERDRVGVAC